ncbi:MAG: hypothetical protein WC757_00140 [Candidatus Paceibacterota bacterium]|jgi:hypothetical protein
MTAVLARLKALNWPVSPYLPLIVVIILGLLSCIGLFSYRALTKPSSTPTAIEAATAVPAVTLDAASTAAGPIPLESSPEPSLTVAISRHGQILDDYGLRLSRLEALANSLGTSLTEVQATLARQQAELDNLKIALPAKAAPASTTPSAKPAVRRRQPLASAASRRRNPAGRDLDAPDSLPLARLVPAYQVLAVNRWGGQKRVLVKASPSNQYQLIKIGDPVSDWTIEAADADQVTLQGTRGRQVLHRQDKGGYE